MKRLLLLCLFLVSICNVFGQTQTKKQATNTHKKKITNYPAPPIKIKDTNQHESPNQGDSTMAKSAQGMDATPPSIPVEEPAHFPGGMDSLRWFIRAHLSYPEIAKEAGIQGKVFISFKVDKEGNISDAKVVKSVNLNLDKAAMRCIMSMPKWVPAKYHGQNVITWNTLPINFVIQ